MSSLPSREECYELLRRHQVPENIIRHSEQVTRVAVFLAQRLSDKGIAVDAELVERAALLHDLFKFVDFADKVELKPESWRRVQESSAGRGHEELGYSFLRKRYPALASAIRCHGYAAVADSSCCPASWEEKIVSYADKRVMHEQIVSLAKRFEDGRRRYNHEETDESRAIERCYAEIEDKIFSILGLRPDCLAEYLAEYRGNKGQ